MIPSPTFRIVRVVLLVAFAVFFFGPLVAMLDFSTRATTGGRSWEAWGNLVKDPELSSAIVTTLLLALFTVVLMLVLLVPTMIWVRLRVPWAARPLEFICLLPLTIPALVIVVGITNVYQWVTYLLGDSTLNLTFVYVVLVLPYAYRSLDSALASIDVTTLAEAARSLGASWFTVITRIIVPNIGSGVLSAAFIAVALVLGEFTIAYLLLFNTLQPSLYSISRNTPNAGVVFSTSLASLLFAFALLIIVSYAGRRRRRG